MWGRVGMVNLISMLVLMTKVISSYNPGFGANGLSMNYYLMSCPFADNIVKDTVNKALQSDPTLAAALLRMHFHDCFIEGCDASILLDSTKNNTAEKDSPANLSLRGYDIMDDAKQQLETQCPGVVSCADIVALAARDAVFWSGGPYYDIPKGRKDGRRSKIEDTINLPSPTFNGSELIRCPRGGCSLSNFDSTHDVDPALDSNFAKILSKTCSTGDTAEQPLDATRNTFDNAYYNALLQKAGVLTSDQTLYTTSKTRSIVNGYAMNQAMFFYDFQQAMLKMSLLDVKDGSNGEVRDNCRKIN
ncbi:hem peroxidase [Dillenia turbinata]|uniref:Peroxidase n=1 Tax=Dillenia turbinata TaxID=194707 RepID=A0AAN8Z3E9_9MAGN